MTDILLVAGWLLWAFNVFIACSFVIGCRKTAAAGRGFTTSTAVQTFLFTLNAVLFVCVPISKLHILWSLPTAFLAGMFLGIGAIPLLSPIAVVMTNVFMSVALMGVRLNEGN